MTRYSIYISGTRGPIHNDTDLTEEELRSRITAFFGDEHSIVFHITKWERGSE